ncbi:MAG: hypothetical protein C5B47_08575 [Verrucomicrobia bacterium]|nr:MAG: hypothetical protein C5B47_08575 [Verrucomicrobiota bacterium]
MRETMRFCMRLLLIILVGILSWPLYLEAQEKFSAFDGVEGTDEMSPLFWDRISLRRTRVSDEQKRISWSQISAGPPAIQKQPDSFQKLFETVNKEIIHRPHRPAAVSGDKTALSLLLEPAQIDLRERREITVTLALTNESKRQLRITFPTSQRMQLFLRDPTGRILEKWPESHYFEPIEEVVAINPDETVQFSQRLPTRKMKGSETYTIEASLFNNSQYSRTISIKPF